MSMYHKRPTVADIRALKGKRQLSMLYVETLDEARAAAAAGIDMLSIIDPFWTSAMREAAGNCFVQVGLLGIGSGPLVTTEDYLRKSAQMLEVGGDSMYCAASFATIAAMAAEGIPVTSHVGLIPSKATWTGGFKAVGKTAKSAMDVYRHVKKLESIGCFAAELEVVPDRIAAEITRRTSMIMLGMGAGPHADAQYLFAEDVLGYTREHRPRHARVYADFATEYTRLQDMRVKAFGSFKADVDTGAYPAKENVAAVSDTEFSLFMKEIETA